MKQILPPEGKYYLPTNETLKMVRHTTTTGIESYWYSELHETLLTVAFEPATSYNFL